MSRTITAKIGTSQRISSGMRRRMSWLIGFFSHSSSYEGIIIEHMSHIWPPIIIIWQSNHACRLFTISIITVTPSSSIRIVSAINIRITYVDSR